ncbi:Vps62-related protein [Streptomyces sp. NPDC047071]|uniref:Vps62-related protein n=1 Tax=Streptomyces sp. NPDC047071 TaxID=3154808 RepID=UPI003454245E
MPESMQYEALDIAVTSRFHVTWDDDGSGARADVTFHAPLYPSLLDHALGWRFIAHTARPVQTNLDRQHVAILARGVDSADEMLKPPVDFELIWRDKGSGARQNGSLWRPVPPEGYVALSDVCVRGWDKPTGSVISCVRKTPVKGRSYVREAEVGAWIWDDRGSGADTDVSVWKVTAPHYPSDSTERLILDLDAFAAHDSHSRPEHPVYVLDLPALIVKQDPPPVPVLTSHHAPEEETLPVTDRQVTVPCTVIKDPSKSPDWQALNSPFYTLERRVSYFRQMFRNNANGTSPQEDTQSITTGVSKEKSEEFSSRTSVSVTASTGIQLKAFSASVETNVTVETGYSSRYGVTVFQEESRSWGMVTPPHSSCALWSPRHEIRAIRKNGEVIGGQGGLKFDENLRISGEYPGTGQARVLLDGTDVTEAEQKALPFGEPQSNVTKEIRRHVAL